MYDVRVAITTTITAATNVISLKYAAQKERDLETTIQLHPIYQNDVVGMKQSKNVTYTGMFFLLLLTFLTQIHQQHNGNQIQESDCLEHRL
jgi:hypothetical protein